MVCFFFFNDTATTEIYTLSLHDALPIWVSAPNSTSLSKSITQRANFRMDMAGPSSASGGKTMFTRLPSPSRASTIGLLRSEKHTSEIQSSPYLVCRLLLEKKKKNHNTLI